MIRRMAATGLILTALVACDDDAGKGNTQDTRGVVDTGAQDTGAADTGSSDTGSADTGAADTGAADTGSADTGSVDTGPQDTTPEDTFTCPTALCAGVCCDESADERCVRDTCLPSLGSCTSNEDCESDSFCDSDGACTAYGDDSGVQVNATCERIPDPAGFRPTVQCEWTAPPAGDPRPNHTSVNSTPVVIDFQIGHVFNTNPNPSIVFTSTSSFSYTNDAYIRIIDGRTCEHQYTIDVEVSSAGTPALGDITGNGRPEIVFWTATGNPIAFTYNEGTDAWDELWQPTFGTPYIAAPSIHDIDNDGDPEIVYGGLVVSHDGVILNPGFTPRALGTYMVPTPVVDIDLDGTVELIEPAGAHTWNGTTNDWELESGWVGTETRIGFVAVGDFGDFPGAAGDGAGHAEIASIIKGEATLRTSLGEVVFGPVNIPGGPDGGNPVVGDFDGDGLAEFGSGGPGSYTTFDPDCLATPRTGGACGSNRTDGILWTKSVRDFSIGINGTSIFDFDGDGISEVVYGDECYLRVFRGSDGAGLFSAQRSSATWLEMPIVADVDADFNAEIVVGNYPYASSCDAVDPNHIGVPCKANAQCVSGSCDAGFCRCTDNSQCPEQHTCAAPVDDSTAGSGNVCRAGYQSSDLLNGIRVYQDNADGWVSSRMIWNQYAYFVSNVGSTGSIPKSDAVVNNWQTTGLNNFRSNTQGSLEPTAAPDLTSRDVRYTCIDETSATLYATVCNRGNEPVGTGTRTGFFRKDESTGELGDPLCIAEPSAVINPAGCTEVSCDWSGSVEGEYNIVVVPDVDGAISECVDDNNGTVLPLMRCQFN